MGGKSVFKEQRIRFRTLLTADFIVGEQRIFVNLFSMRSPKIHKIDDLSLYSLCSLHNIRYRIFAGFLPVFHRKFDTLTFAFPFFSKYIWFF